MPLLLLKRQPGGVVGQSLLTIAQQDGVSSCRLECINYNAYTINTRIHTCCNDNVVTRAETSSWAARRRSSESKPFSLRPGCGAAWGGTSLTAKR